MKRLSWAAAAVLAVCVLPGCGDQTIHRRNPPRDPPDYHGVPTDVTPPTMLDAPASGSASPSQ